MREGKSDARSFYEIECTQMQWSVRHQCHKDRGE